MSNIYRYISYATPSAVWSYDTASQLVTLFWKADGTKITYNPNTLHYAEHKERTLRLSKERQSS